MFANVREVNLISYLEAALAVRLRFVEESMSIRLIFLGGKQKNKVSFEIA